MKWQRESGIDISEEDWSIIWQYQWKCTSSISWREFNWKNFIRYFTTPCQTAHYSDSIPLCWRKCGHQSANHYHIFWECPSIKNFWKEIHNFLQDIFLEDIPLDFKTIYLECIPQGWLKEDKSIYLSDECDVGGQQKGHHWLIPEYN